MAAPGVGLKSVATLDGAAIVAWDDAAAAFRHVEVSPSGGLVVHDFALPSADWSFAVAAPITGTADTALKAAAGAGIRNYLVAIQVKNTNATATEIVIKDGGTVIWRGHVGANMLNADPIVFPKPLKSSANAALNFAAITTAASVYVSAQGYTGA
jgi:hypothetical protein